jgi:predicted ABC-type sugar transport system permease subunit
MGVLAALAGLVFAARLNTATPKAGAGFELDVIAACIIGGASAYGGVGRVAGAVIGALIMGVMNNGMSGSTTSRLSRAWCCWVQCVLTFTTNDVEARIDRTRHPRRMNRPIARAGTRVPLFQSVRRRRVRDMCTEKSKKKTTNVTALS